MAELERFGYAVNGEIKIDQKIDFVRIISSLWFFGYMKETKIYTGSEFVKIGKSVNFLISYKHANDHKEYQEEKITIKLKPYTSKNPA